MQMLTVYYDELCVVCSAEINHYKKQSGSEKIRFVDISAPTFDANLEGIDPFQVHKIMHAKKQNGELLTRVDAFIAIWQLLPKYGWLHRFSQNLLLRKLMDLGYNIFAAVRPYLPRKKNQHLCEVSSFCETHQKMDRK